MAKLLCILLQRSDSNIPWGFRLTGGKDFGCPLSIQRVTPGTLAAQHLSPGDIVLLIQGKGTDGMYHMEANDLIREAGNSLELTVKKCSDKKRCVSVPTPSLVSPTSFDYPAAPWEDKISPRSSWRITSPVMKSPPPPIMSPSFSSDDQWQTPPTPRLKSPSPALPTSPPPRVTTPLPPSIWFNSDDEIDSPIADNDNRWMSSTYAPTLQETTPTSPVAGRPSSTIKRQSSQISGNGSPATPGSTGFGDTSTGPPPPPAFPASGAPPPPPPPPPVPGSVPTVRLNSEIPDSRGKGFPPAAIQTAMMTKDKKPFTYTPGGIDLSEIRSPRMARRITRNAMAEGITSEPRPSNLQPSGPTPPTPPHTLPPQALAAMQPQIAIPVFPQGPPLNKVPAPPPPGKVPASPQTPRPTSVPPSPQTPKPSPVPASPQQTRPSPVPASPQTHRPSPVPASPQTHRPSPVPASPQTHRPSPVPASPGPEGHRISPNFSKVSSQPQTPPTPPTPGPQFRNEPGSIYVPPVASAPSGRPNAQLGSIYIPPVPTQQQQQQQQATPGTPGSPVYNQLNKAPVPWMNSQNRHQQHQPPQLPPYVHPPQQTPVTPGNPPWQQAQKQGPQTRIIPIQVEGRPTPVQPKQEERVIPVQVEREAGLPRPGQGRVIPMQVEGHQQQTQQRRPGPVYVHNKYSGPQAADLASGVENMGLSDQGAPIQSRSFRVLQKITNTDEQPGGVQSEWANESVPGGQPKLELTDEDRDLMNKFKTQVNDESYLHSESDPRYRGAYIPSRAFRILQTMTDSGDEAEMPRGPSVRGGPPQRAPGMAQGGDQAGPYVPPSEQQAAEPKKYTGGSIPSRSFRMLQAMTAPNQVEAEGDESSSAQDPEATCQRVENSPNSKTPRSTPTPLPTQANACNGQQANPKRYSWPIGACEDGGMYGYQMPWYYPDYDPYWEAAYMYGWMGDYGQYYPTQSLPEHYGPYPIPHKPYQYAYNDYPYDYNQYSDGYGYYDYPEAYTSGDESMAGSEQSADYENELQSNVDKYLPRTQCPTPEIVITPSESEIDKHSFSSDTAKKMEHQNKDKDAVKENGHDSDGSSDVSSEESEEDSTESETEVEESTEYNKDECSNSGNLLRSIRSVPNVNSYGDGDEGSESDRESSEVNGEETEEDTGYIVEEPEDDDTLEDLQTSGKQRTLYVPHLPHQLSVIYEESEHSCSSDAESVRKSKRTRQKIYDTSEASELSSYSDVESVHRDISSRVDDSDAGSTTTLDKQSDITSEDSSTLASGQSDDESDGDGDDVDPESTVTVCLPLKLQFSKSGAEDGITTVIVGDSILQKNYDEEINKASTSLIPIPETPNDTTKDIIDKEHSEEDEDENDEESDEENDTSVSFTISFPSNKTVHKSSSKTGLSKIKNSKSSTKVTEVNYKDSAKNDSEKADAETDVSVCLSLPLRTRSSETQEDTKAKSSSSKADVIRDVNSETSESEDERDVGKGNRDMKNSRQRWDEDSDYTLSHWEDDSSSTSIQTVKLSPHKKADDSSDTDKTDGKNSSELSSRGSFVDNQKDSDDESSSEEDDDDEDEEDEDESKPTPSPTDNSTTSKKESESDSDDSDDSDSNEDINDKPATVIQTSEVTNVNGVGIHNKEKEEEVSEDSDDSEQPCNTAGDKEDDEISDFEFLEKVCGVGPVIVTERDKEKLCSMLKSVNQRNSSTTSVNSRTSSKKKGSEVNDETKYESTKCSEHKGTSTQISTGKTDNNIDDKEVRTEQKNEVDNTSKKVKTKTKRKSDEKGVNSLRAYCLTHKYSQDSLGSEDDSGVTDMSRQISETDTESECTNEKRAEKRSVQYQRVSTHSRLYKLLQDECSKEDDDDDDDSQGILPPAPGSLSSRKECLTLPLKINESDSLSSSGVTSPSSPTATDRMIADLVDELSKKRGKRQKKKTTPAKMRAIALQLLQEELHSNDAKETPSGDALSHNAGSIHSNALSPQAYGLPTDANTAIYTAQSPQDFYYDDYCNSFDYYGSSFQYNIMPSRAFRFLQEQVQPRGYSASAADGSNIKCPRISPSSSQPSIVPRSSSSTPTTPISSAQSHMTTASPVPSEEQPCSPPTAS